MISWLGSPVEVPRLDGSGLLLTGLIKSGRSVFTVLPSFAISVIVEPAAS